MQNFFHTFLFVLSEIFSPFVLKRVFLGLLIIYVLLCIFLFIKQDSLIFFPTAPTLLPLDTRIQSIDYDIDGIHYSGFIKRGAGPTIFYFGGNASEAKRGIHALKHNATTISFNYRGYGATTGSPSEKNLFADAVTLYDRLEKDGLLKQADTILYGKSLGTGVASYLSSVRPSKAIILITPYDSLRAVAQANYPIIPVKYLLRHHFDSMSFLENYKNPLLIVYGGKDVVIPNQHTKNLIAHTQSGTEVFFVEQAGHDDILDFPQSQARIDAFLQEVMKRR